MNNEEAVKILNTVLFFGKCDCQMEEIEECLKMAIEALKKSEWISCSERLPEEAGLYLVSMHRLGYPQREIDGFVRGKWERYGNNVIAWMPLPEEYKKEGNK